MKELFLPVIPGVEEVIAAEGPVTEQLLAELAVMLTLTLREGASGAFCAVEMFDREPAGAREPWEPWQGWGVYPVTLKHWPEQHRLRVIAPTAAALKELFRMRILRRILCFPLLRHLALKNIALMHGALLSSGDGKHGTVLFAESGMGKSTASQRYADQGGISVSDDRLMLGFTPHGEIFARPLPTWKNFPHAPPMEFARKIRVTGFFMLFRGYDDRIEEAPADNWHIALCKSLADTLVTPRLWLPPELREKFLPDSLWPMELLEKHFGRYQLCGDLHGHIFRNISDFEERNALL